MDSVMKPWPTRKPARTCMTMRTTCWMESHIFLSFHELSKRQNQRPEDGRPDNSDGDGYGGWCIAFPFLGVLNVGGGRCRQRWRQIRPGRHQMHGGDESRHGAPKPARAEGRHVRAGSVVEQAPDGILLHQLIHVRALDGGHCLRPDDAVRRDAERLLQ